MNKLSDIAEKLVVQHHLTAEEYAFLIKNRDEKTAAFLAENARSVRESIYGKDVYVRGLIEFSNYCRNDCYYCGIRRSNDNARRYRLTAEDILACCEEGYALGYRTFVLQSGEDMTFTAEKMADLVASIKARFPDCAITLSVGEREKEVYALWKQAGADRYLLRHETANDAHYRLLHPQELSLKHRKQCLADLKELGYQVGAGFMVSPPGQTPELLAEDMVYLEELAPEMVGLGPFIPQKDTPFREEAAGTLELTIFMLSVVRLALPTVLLPATTALGTIDPQGREKGMLAGANVCMPNLSPMSVRAKYALYDNKVSLGEEGAQAIEDLKKRMESIGYHVVTARGDHASHVLASEK